MNERVDFEKTMAELEDLVKKLETGDLPLAQALEDFEKGVGLVKTCQNHLDQAKAQVDALLAESSSSDESSETSN